MEDLIGLGLDEVMERHADVRGGLPAVTIGDHVITFADLDRYAERLADELDELGVTHDRFVTVAWPNSIDFIVGCMAAWKLGAIPQPVSSRLPASELSAIVELADAAAVLGMEQAGRPSHTVAIDLDAPVPEPQDRPAGTRRGPVASAWKAPTSGGSTGRPKLIVSGDPATFEASLPTRAERLGAMPDETMVMPGPLYHNGPFIWSWMTLLVGGHLVLLPRFDAEATLAAIDTHRARSAYFVPTMMQRMWKLPEHVKDRYDLSSLQRAWHLAEPCPPWLKEVWIEWIGPEALWELYGGTEGQASTVISGVEWLEHRGSVGRPEPGAMKICDDDGNDLPAGEVGEVWMRPLGRDTPTYRYIGAESEPRDGWECLGDIGWMDADGYLYLADRRTDMILIGGANVFPAEVEAALNEHPEVDSSAVIGLPDDDKGNRIHAIVNAPGGTVSTDELLAHLAERLVTYKRPRTIEFVDEPVRDDAGKVRRSALRAERLPAG